MKKVYQQLQVILGITVNIVTLASHPNQDMAGI